MTKNDANLSVLVTAGGEKQSLAAVRSLGQSGAMVDVLDSKPDAPALRSRYCRRGWTSPSIHDRKTYVDFLDRCLTETSYTTLLACDDMTAKYLSEERVRFEARTALALPPLERFRCATDKSELARFASGIGIPVPRTERPRSLDEVEPLARTLGFPIIVKGSHGWGAQHVRLVEKEYDLSRAFVEVAELEARDGGDLPMLQEYVRGVGYGFSTLFRNGEPRAFFMHRRAAEFDVQSKRTPYSCPVAEGIQDDELQALGLRLFEALEWHGLGMAEWRREEGTGRFVLLEVNPRLPGSTDLAIRSGVDLPLLACRMLRDGDVPQTRTYRTGLRVSWLVPDTLQDLLARPRRILEPTTWRSGNDWSLRDLAPHWMQLRRLAWQLRHRHS